LRLTYCHEKGACEMNNSASGFAAKLRELREAKGLSQSGLARESGIALGTIRDYEQGRGDPLFSKAQRLAHVLGVSLAVFPLPVDLVGPVPVHAKTKRR